MSLLQLLAVNPCECLYRQRSDFLFFYFNNSVLLVIAWVSFLETLKRNKALKRAGQVLHV